jgi:O-antigen/teichoic acid export membrane protein
MSARLIAPANYATLTACLSLLVVAAVPAAVLQLATASYAADPHFSRAHVLGIQRMLLRGGVIFGVILGMLVLLGSAPLGSFLHLPNLTPLWLTAVILGTSFIGPVYQGSLQGAHRFTALAAVTSSSFAIRVVVAAVLLALGMGEVGALAGVLLGTLGSAFLGAMLCRTTETVPSREVLPLRELARTVLPTFTMQLSLTSMLFIDTLLSKHFFTPAIVGAYAGLATTARVLAYLPGALSVLLFPLVTRLRSNQEQRRFVTRSILAATALAETIPLALCIFAPALVLHIVVGDRYLGAADQLPWLAIGLTAYAFANLLANYLLAMRSRSFLAVLIAFPIILIVSMALFHDSLSMFVHAITIVMIAFLGCLTLIFARSGNAAVTEGMTHDPG